MVEIARAMLAGTLSLLEGARSIVALYRDAGLAHLDKDIVPFVVVDSETDALPLGAQRLNWQREALAKLQPGIDRREAFTRRDLLEPSRALIDRFGASSGSCETQERNDAEGEN